MCWNTRTMDMAWLLLWLRKINKQITCKEPTGEAQLTSSVMLSGLRGESLSSADAEMPVGLIGGRMGTRAESGLTSSQDAGMAWNCLCERQGKNANVGPAIFMSFTCDVPTGTFHFKDDLFGLWLLKTFMNLPHIPLNNKSRRSCHNFQGFQLWHRNRRSVFPKFCFS